MGVEDSKKPDSLYQAWVIDPVQTPLNEVVKSLQPSIDYALHSINASDDPYMKSKAKVVAAEAVKSFNPSTGSALPTWVSNQMMRLRRIKRQTQSVTKVPERIQLDNYAIYRAEQEFMDKHDREPDMEELSDAVKLPIKRIEKVRLATRKTPSEGALEGAVSNFETDFENDALEYVYRDADYIDRKILEMKTGYGGNEVMQPKLIAQKLKLTPVQLNRRSMKLTMKIQELTKALEDVA
jgi:DNA-directed RNA polymerase specialized sigma subunit